MDATELGLLKQTVESDVDLLNSSYGRNDGEAGKTKLALWDDPADDITGVIARAEKVAGTFEKVIYTLQSVGVNIVD